MDAKQYQELAARTLIDKPTEPISDQDIMIIWNAIGLAGEVGEIAELILHKPYTPELSKELGDAIWYIAALATKLNLDFGRMVDAAKTSIPNLSLHLCIYASTVSELCKKGIFHQHGLDIQEVMVALIGCLKCINALATEHDFNLLTIMKDNIDKLKKRYPDGYSSEDSEKRIDVI